MSRHHCVEARRSICAKLRQHLLENAGRCLNVAKELQTCIGTKCINCVEHQTPPTAKHHRVDAMASSHLRYLLARAEMAKALLLVGECAFEILQSRIGPELIPIAIARGRIRGVAGFMRDAKPHLSGPVRPAIFAHAAPEPSQTLSQGLDKIQ